MIEYIDYRTDVNRVDSILNDFYPKISRDVTSTGIDSLEQWSSLWSEHVGFDSPYGLYENLLKYENKSKRKTSDIIGQWQEGTLRRDSQINDWISTYLLFEGYLNK